jgi:hypothetical protein
VGHARHGAAPGVASGAPVTAVADPAAAGGTPAATAPGGGRPPGRHRRRRSPRGLLLLVALLLGGTLALLAAGDRWLFADRPAGQAASAPASTAAGSSAPASSAPASTAPGSSPGTTASGSAPALAPLPPDADTADEQLGATTAAVTAALAADPGAVGPAGEGLLAGLRQVEAADGPARRLAAVVAADSVTTALGAGRLDADAGRQVLGVLAAVARPERLVDVVAMVEQGPPAIGPAGPELFGDLFALDHHVPADQVAPRAAELLAAVTAAVADGRVSGSFAAMVTPLLERLADPAPQQRLADLLAGVEADPGRVGPASGQVLGALRALAQQPVFPQGNAAAELRALVQQDGRVTPAFREEATPVLDALVR